MALYWAPEPQDRLAACGASWLGRDAETNASVRQPDLPGLAEITQAPRGYGFHATLRPPMRLATGWEEFIQAARKVAAACTPFDMPRLCVAEMKGFLAIGTAAPCPTLRSLADDCVAATDRHRLRADASELARRRQVRLSEQEDRLLLRWGYPYVMGSWRFHMTLTRRLDAAEMALLRPHAEAHFADALRVPRRCTAISVFTQRNDSPFLIAERIGLGTPPTKA